AGGARATSTIAPDLPELIRHVPGVAEVETIRGVVVNSEFGPVNLSAADTQRRRAAALYRFAQGDPQQVWQDMVQGAVIVSEPFAYRHGLPATGAKVTLQTDEGPHVFPIVGIYYDYSSDQGTILMPITVYQQFWRDRGISGIAVYDQAGADVQVVADAL